MYCKSLPLSILAAALLSACGAGSGDLSTSSSSSSSSAGAPRLLADTVVNFAIAGPRANYSVWQTTSGWLIKDDVGGAPVIQAPAGTTHLQFNDVTVNLNMEAQARSIPAASLKALIELYIAFFNRAPDADGMTYWIGQLRNGASLVQLGDIFYGVATSAQYTALTGYSASMTNEDFIKIIYKNVLGRDEVDAAGMTYWTGELSSGRQSRGSLVAAILSAAHSYKADAQYGYVADLLDNKASVGDTFAVRRALTYRSDTQSYTVGQQVSKAVTPTSTGQAETLIDNISGAISSGPNGSGSGNVSDCYNPALFGNGAGYTIKTRSKTFGTAAQETTAKSTVATGAAFNGQTAIETQTMVTSDMVTAGKILFALKSYNQLSASTVFNLGNILSTETATGFFVVTQTNTPAQQQPVNLAVNTPFSQTYTVKSTYNTGLPANNSTETSVTTMLGLENVTVPAGTFLACKMKTETTVGGVTGATYSWVISSGGTKGLAVKSEDGQGGWSEALSVQ